MALPVVVVQESIADALVEAIVEKAKDRRGSGLREEQPWARW